MFPEGLGLVPPLAIKFNCTGIENNLVECSNNSADNCGTASASGSGSTGVSGMQDDLLQQSLDSCLNLARVECNGWWAIVIHCVTHGANSVWCWQACQHITGADQRLVTKVHHASITSAYVK